MFLCVWTHRLIISSVVSIYFYYTYGKPYKALISSSIISITASAAAQAIGFPP